MNQTRHRASFTVEATVVLTVVIFGISALIGQMYRIHDTVTGTMILEEMLVKARDNCGDETKDLAEQLELAGETLGNPRLWLGEYGLEIEMDDKSVSGKATAGDWTLEIELERFRPGQFLRRYEAIREIGEELTDDGSGVQAGDEPELYGSPGGERR